LYGAAGHRRSPVTMPGYHHGRPPRNKGLRYPADPPTVEEIVAVMRAAGGGADGARLRAVIVLLWRAGLQGRSPPRGRHGPLGVASAPVLARDPISASRRRVPCVVHGPTAGRRWDPSAARKQLRVTAAAAGVRRRFAPHQLRHAHAIEMAHEGVPLVVIQRQLGHANLGITSIYLQGIDSSEIIETVHARPAPVISASAGLRPNAQ
jgi:Phage integrase family